MNYTILDTNNNECVCFTFCKSLQHLTTGSGGLTSTRSVCGAAASHAAPRKPAVHAGRTEGKGNNVRNVIETDLVPARAWGPRAML